MHPKRIALLAAILSLAFTGVAHADTITAGGLTADVYGQPTNGRVFLFHALNAQRDWYSKDAAPISTLVADGYQVVTPDEPYDHSAPNQGAALRAAFLSDGTAGQSYRDQWAGSTHDLIAAADTRYGTAPRLLMGGTSWGGFSALLAACSNPEVDGYFVTIPAVDPNGLPEWADVPLGNLKLWTQGCDTRLAAMPGLLLWGDQDVRVGTAGTRRLLPSLGGSVTNCEYPMGHGTDTFTMTSMARWVTGERDCLPYAADPVAPTPAPTVASRASTLVPAAAPAVSASASHAPVAGHVRCSRSNHCRTVVRRGKVYRVYSRHGKRARWVYVRRASRR